MLIDWFTVAAQVVNFLVLVWLLKRFLYQPVINAIDAREKQIAAQLAEVQAKKTDADKARDDFQAKSKAFDDQRGALLSQVTDEARAEREHLLADARQEVDALRTRQQDALRRDRVNLGKEITRLTQDEVFAITRRTLSDLAAASLEERMSEVFTRRLRDLDAKAKEALATALQRAVEPALLRSTFTLADESRAAIQKALNETFAAAVRVQFETTPDAVCGIELTVSGQKLAWSIEDYLTSLQQQVAALLDAQFVPPATDASSRAPARTPAPALSNGVPVEAR